LARPLDAFSGAVRAMVTHMMILPAYEPPSDKRASVAVALAPVFVVVVFSLIASGLIAFDTGVAIFLGCNAWVVYEMLDYQRAVDAYNQQCMQTHWVWRGPEALEALAQDLEPVASDFMRGFVGAGPGLLPDQPHS
jgi:hypothetical protein